jgi:hypothetical protein
LSDQFFACYTAVNMATALSMYTKEEQHDVICFLWAEGVSGAESCQNGNDILSQ